MNGNKYELLDDIEIHNGCKFHRIKALIAFSCVDNSRVNVGDIGGLVQSGDNLSQNGACWIWDNARVVGDAQVKESAIVKDSVVISGDAVVTGEAIITDSVVITDAAVIGGKSIIKGDTVIKGRVIIKDHTLKEEVNDDKMVVDEMIEALKESYSEDSRTISEAIGNALDMLSEEIIEVARNFLDMDRI